MLSTCPSCLNQILHEDSVDQVKCECGEAFSPFLSATPPVSFDSSSLMAMSEKSSVQPVLEGPLSEPSSNGTSPTETPSAFDYSESEAAFAELRTFGEGLGAVDNELVQPSSSSPNTPTSTTSAPVSQSGLPKAPPLGTTPSSPTALSSNCCITAGDSLDGYEIESFLAPLSVWCPSSVEAEDPLRQAHEMLAQRASSLGASGVVSVRWSFTPDGSRILLTGTPVKCRKKG